MRLIHTSLFAAIAGYGIRVARHDNLRATWRLNRCPSRGILPSPGTRLTPCAACVRKIPPSMSV